MWAISQSEAMSSQGNTRPLSQNLAKHVEKKSISLAGLSNKREKTILQKQIGKAAPYQPSSLQASSEKICKRTSVKFPSSASAKRRCSFRERVSKGSEDSRHSINLSVPAKFKAPKMIDTKRSIHLGKSRLIEHSKMVPKFRLTSFSLETVVSKNHASSHQKFSSKANCRRSNLTTASAKPGVHCKNSALCSKSMYQSVKVRDVLSATEIPPSSTALSKVPISKTSFSLNRRVKVERFLQHAIDNHVDKESSKNDSFLTQERVSLSHSQKSRAEGEKSLRQLSFGKGNNLSCRKALPPEISLSSNESSKLFSCPKGLTLFGKKEIKGKDVFSKIDFPTRKVKNKTSSCKSNHMKKFGTRIVVTSMNNSSNNKRDEHKESRSFVASKTKEFDLSRGERAVATKVDAIKTLSSAPVNETETVKKEVSKAHYNSPRHASKVPDVSSPLNGESMGKRDGKQDPEKPFQSRTIIKKKKRYARDRHEALGEWKNVIGEVVRKTLSVEQETEHNSHTEIGNIKSSLAYLSLTGLRLGNFSLMSLDSFASQKLHFQYPAGLLKDLKGEDNERLVKELAQLSIEELSSAQKKEDLKYPMFWNPVEKSQNKKQSSILTPRVQSDIDTGEDRGRHQKRRSDSSIKEVSCITRKTPISTQDCVQKCRRDITLSSSSYYSLGAIFNGHDISSRNTTKKMLSSPVVRSSLALSSLATPAAPSRKNNYAMGMFLRGIRLGNPSTIMEAITKYDVDPNSYVTVPASLLPWTLLTPLLRSLVSSNNEGGFQRNGSLVRLHPLHLAVVTSTPSIVKILVKLGCCVNALDEWHRNPLQILLQPPYVPHTLQNSELFRPRNRSSVMKIFERSVSEIENCPDNSSYVDLLGISVKRRDIIEACTDLTDFLVRQQSQRTSIETKIALSLCEMGIDFERKDFDGQTCNDYISVWYKIWSLIDFGMFNLSRNLKEDSECEAVKRELIFSSRPSIPDRLTLFENNSSDPEVPVPIRGKNERITHQKDKLREVLFAKLPMKLVDSVSVFMNQMRLDALYPVVGFYPGCGDTLRLRRVRKSDSILRCDRDLSLQNPELQGHANHDDTPKEDFPTDEPEEDYALLISEKCPMTRTPKVKENITGNKFYGIGTRIHGTQSSEMQSDLSLPFPVYSSVVSSQQKFSCAHHSRLVESSEQSIESLKRFLLARRSSCSNRSCYYCEDDNKTETPFLNNNCITLYPSPSPGTTRFSIKQFDTSEILNISKEPVVRSECRSKILPASFAAHIMCESLNLTGRNNSKLQPSNSSFEKTNKDYNSEIEEPGGNTKLLGDFKYLSRSPTDVNLTLDETSPNVEIMEKQKKPKCSDRKINCEPSSAKEMRSSIPDEGSFSVVFARREKDELARFVELMSLPQYKFHPAFHGVWAFLGIDFLSKNPETCTNVMEDE